MRRFCRFAYWIALDKQVRRHSNGGDFIQRNAIALATLQRRRSEIAPWTQSLQIQLIAIVNVPLLAFPAHNAAIDIQVSIEFRFGALLISKATEQWSRHDADSPCAAAS